MITDHLPRDTQNSLLPASSIHKFPDQVNLLAKSVVTITVNAKCNG